jgi:hypothetical protein
LSNDGDGPSCYLEQTRKARREHLCCECRETIPAGAKYEYVSGIWDGRPSVYKTCLSCAEIRKHFACGGGWIYGELWSQLIESFYPDMKAGGRCMEGLSPEAKGRLFESRLAWVFDSEREHDGAPPPYVSSAQRPIREPIDPHSSILMGDE